MIFDHFHKIMHFMDDFGFLNFSLSFFFGICDFFVETNIRFTRI